MQGDASASLENSFLSAVRFFAVTALLGATFAANAQDQTQPQAPPAANPAVPAQPAGEGEPPAAAADDATKFPEVVDAIELFKQLKFNESREKLREAVQKHPELAPADLIYAELLIKSGQIPLGRKEIEDVVVAMPGDPRAYMALGAIGLAEGRWTDALLQYEKAAEVAQTFAFVNDEEKQKFLNKCSLGRGTVHENRKNWSLARKEFEKWLESDPKNGPIRQRLARAIFFEGDVERAFKELQQAKADDDRLSPPETALASFYATNNDFEKAEEYFKKGIEAESDELIPYQTYAQWLFNRGRTKEAKEQTMVALRALPTNRTLRLMRSIFARHLKAYDEAETELEDLLRESSDDAMVRNELALTLAEQPDPTKTRRAFELAAQNVRANQRSADLLATFGWVNYRLGNLDQAERFLKAALQLSQQQTRPELFYYMAHVLAERGNNADAKKLLDQIVASDAPFAFKDEAKEWAKRLADAEASTTQTPSP